MGGVQSRSVELSFLVGLGSNKLDCSYVGPCGSCWQWPLFSELLCVWKYWGRGDSEGLEWKDMMLDVSVQSTHTGTAFVVQWEERLEN